MGIREQQHNVLNSVKKKKEQIVLKCRVLFFWANRSLHCCFFAPSLCSTFLVCSILIPCVNVCSGVVSGTITLFQHRGGWLSAHHECVFWRRGQETPSLMEDNSNLLGRRGEDISLHISSPASAQGNYHSWHWRELKFKSTRPQIT